jgi:hypothetical protein
LHISCDPLYESCLPNQIHNTLYTYFPVLLLLNWMVESNFSWCSTHSTMTSRCFKKCNSWQQLHCGKLLYFVNFTNYKKVHANRPKIIPLQYDSSYSHMTVSHHSVTTHVSTRCFLSYLTKKPWPNALLSFYSNL